MSQYCGTVARTPLRPVQTSEGEKMRSPVPTRPKSTRQQVDGVEGEENVDVKVGDVQEGGRENRC
jgi:uncharacterized protein YggU (UPF0235/DUF167 family)